MELLTECPICADPRSALFLTCKDHTVSFENFEIKECSNCHFKYTNPRPDTLEIGNYYHSENYISHSNTRKGLINQIYHWVRRRTLRQKLALLNRLSKQKNLLDVGTGTGMFPQFCQESGWVVNATEPDTQTRAMASANIGKPVYDTLFAKELQGQQFGIITMWHVLEHVHLLHETVEKLYELLDEKGTLIVAVPNSASFESKVFGSNWAAYDVPRHLYHFSHETIQMLFDKHRFKISEILPMYYDAYYISLLSNRYASGHSKYFNAVLTGFRSNRWAKKNNKNYSSNIYVINKK